MRRSGLSWVRPLPRRVTRPMSIVILVAWVAAMATIVNRSYVQASPNLSADLARYGTNAQWRGVYYRGEKIGFTVSQTVALDDGFELQEDGQLQMSLLGATTFAQIRTTAQVDAAFVLRSFEFSLDPGTGPIQVRGTVDGNRLSYEVVSASGGRGERIDLEEPPALGLNLSRRLANGLLKAGARYHWSMFDPATLRNSPVVVDVGERELVRTGGRSLPAFRVDLEVSGLKTTTWVTDTGEVVREESPMGLITVREPAERAKSLAVSREVQLDMLEAAAVVPAMRERIDDPRDVVRLRLRVDGADLGSPDLQGAGQTVGGNIVEVADARSLRAGPADPSIARYLAPEPLIESDAPEIQAEAQAAVRGVTGSRARAEQLTRHVNALLDKKPTVSLPSAREVLRTRIGDCNEHTTLYVAMARAVGIPARIAVGLTYVRGAFYYHAWPEVYVDEGSAGGFWLPVDPTLNQFPADTTHVRLARGGLAQQAAILPMIGRLRMTVLDLELAPGATPILVGQSLREELAPAPVLSLAGSGSCDCWCQLRQRRR